MRCPAAASVVLTVGNHDHGLLAPALQRRAVAEPRAGAAGGRGRDRRARRRAAGARLRGAGQQTGDGVATRACGCATTSTRPTATTSTATRPCRRSSGSRSARWSGWPANRPAGRPAPRTMRRVWGPCTHGWTRTPGPAAGPGRDRRSLPGGRSGQGNRARGGLRRRALRAAFPAIVAGLNRAGLGPVSDDVSIDTLRSSSLRGDRRGAAAAAGRRAVRDLRSHPPSRAAAGRRRRTAGGRRPGHGW